MKLRTAFLLLVICVLSYPGYARHGKGGVLTYEYLGAGNAAGTSSYRISVRHYINCEETNAIESSVFIGIFNAQTNALIRTVTVAKTNQSTIQKTYFDPCINPKPTVCYVLADYVTTLELADLEAGYILAEQECCRVANINNAVNSSGYGSTNYNAIPGTIGGLNYKANSSPVFAQRDTTVICFDSYFTLDFGATDADGDSLVYEFCSAKVGASMQNRQPNPPASPPYSDLPYATGYSGSQPLGNEVTIDSKTGLISGTAPSESGQYIISVCVSEYRSAVRIGITKKEVQVTVADCSLYAASLQPSYVNCDDYGFTFSNLGLTTSSLKYFWDFGVPGLTTDTSSLLSPSFTYPDTGTYTLKLKVASVDGCQDSTTAKVIVYPGFYTGFTSTGSCYQSPFLFADTSWAKYGSITSRYWTLGDGATQTVAFFSHVYGTVNSYQVSLIVESSKGCKDTVTHTVQVTDKPALQLAFKDTLICSIDTLQLMAQGNGVFSWTSAEPVINPSGATPLVFPRDTAIYIVQLVEDVCVATDTVKVNVLDHITVSLPPDTSICKTDSIQLKPVSYALQYQWLPPTGLSNAFIKNPMASPENDIRYEVVANLGKCQDRASVLVKVVPYPLVTAGIDTAICYGDIAYLHGATNGSFFTWSPLGVLEAANTLNPAGSPLQTTSYVLTVYDTLGCANPSRDTVLVIVASPIQAFAGNDTSIVVGQVLQLQATGGTAYHWSPPTGLSNADIANPVASLTTATDTILYVVRVSDNIGCYADDSVKVIVFKTAAEIFVPSAFTPDNNGLNDVLKPILAGIKKLERFRIYNRWGQLVFNSSQPNQGWDGNYNGQPQQPGVFVFYASAIDYTGRRIVRKGTITLIR